MSWPTDALQAFAAELRLDQVLVQGSCDPTVTSPYLRLDVHAWEQFKRNTGERGTKALPQIGLAATLLLLWFRRSQAGLATVTIDQAQDVLKTISLRDKNAIRGLKNCDWLQAFDGNVRLNPAKFSHAVSIARAFCAHTTIEDRQPNEKS